MIYDGPVENESYPGEKSDHRIGPRHRGPQRGDGQRRDQDPRGCRGGDRLGADLVAVGRAVVVDPEWLSKVRSQREGSILAGLPRDEREIAGALSIPPRMVEYLLSRPGWIPRAARTGSL